MFSIAYSPLPGTVIALNAPGHMPSPCFHDDPDEGCTMEHFAQAIKLISILKSSEIIFSSMYHGSEVVPQTSTLLLHISAVSTESAFRENR